MTTARTATRGPARRAELLDQLVEVFLAEGFATFTLDELARRLHCSKSTLYAVAGSKEQLVVAAVRRFFARATVAVEERAAAPADAGGRIEAYLLAVSEQLRPASATFFADLAAFPPAAEVYAANTRTAARRVQQLVSAGVGAGELRPAHASFVGAAVTEVMAAIHAGRIAAATDLDDAAAYAELAALVVAGLHRSRP